MTDKQQRLPRFKRDPDAAGSFQVTQRDLEILRHVAEHRFIRSEWLVCLAGGSRQQVLRRLNLLYHHGYLERPRCQLDYYHEGGSKSLVYGLASRGAGRIRRDLNIPFERMGWGARNKSAGRLFIEHTLMVSDFMAALELDCRARSDTHLLYIHEMLDLVEGQKHVQLSRWNTQLSHRRQRGIVPDKVFALEITRPDGSIKHIRYFLEADRGSMPIERRDHRQSSITGKLKAYQTAHRKRVLRSPLGTRFHVLIIAKGTERCKGINNAIEKTVVTRGIFFVMSDQHLRDCNCRAFEITAGIGKTQVT